MPPNIHRLILRLGFFLGIFQWLDVEICCAHPNLLAAVLRQIRFRLRLLWRISSRALDGECRIKQATGNSIGFISYIWLLHHTHGQYGRNAHALRILRDKSNALYRLRDFR